MIQITKKIAKLIFAISILLFFTFISVSPVNAASKNTVASTGTTLTKQQKNLARQELVRVYVQGIHTIKQAFNEAIQTIGTQFRTAMRSVTTNAERAQLIKARNQGIQEVVRARQDGLRQLREIYLAGLREINSL